MAGYAMVNGVNIPEPKLTGAIAKTAVGKTTGLVQGAAAVYVAKVTSQKRTADKFDANAEMNQVAQMNGQRAYQAAFSYLITNKSDMKDRRYEF